MTTCHSTNDEAALLIAKQKVIEGTIVITDNQTAGKGQRGNSWNSTPGKNLTFSIILKPNFLSIVQQFDLNIAVSLGILDYLNRIRNGFEVKWPNDVYFGEKKVCGILIQNNIKGQQLEHAIVGIGLNINQLEFAHPNAISLSTITGNTFDLSDVFEALLLNIEKRYIQLKRGELVELKQDYLDHMYRFGEDFLYRAGEVFNGRITGITDQGLLEIETNQGLKQFGFKEVEFIP
ncbi:biotin--[acetyl-CoA-carboxylase] ligase [Fulvivirga imtechensis]|nr:biotin--[acetyl-CoA-carboxylase] ligase [Fulvivirga imtechensis]